MRLDHIAKRICRRIDCIESSLLSAMPFYGLPDDDSELEPPDPIPNSAVKRLSADGSVGSPHVRVGHRQASIGQEPGQVPGFCFSGRGLG